MGNICGNILGNSALISSHSQIDPCQGVVASRPTFGKLPLQQYRALIGRPRRGAKSKRKGNDNSLKA